jgi:hypothetical protein
MQSTVSPSKPGACHLSACITPCGVSGVPQGHWDHVRKGGRKPPYPPCPSAGLASRGRGGARGGLLRSCEVSNFEFACLRLHKVRAASTACCDWPGPCLLAPFHSSLPPHHAARAGTCHMALVAQPYQNRAPNVCHAVAGSLEEEWNVGTRSFSKRIIRLGQSVILASPPLPSPPAPALALAPVIAHEPYRSPRPRNWRS